MSDSLLTNSQKRCSNNNRTHKETDVPISVVDIAGHPLLKGRIGDLGVVSIIIIIDSIITATDCRFVIHTTTRRKQ